MSASQERQIAVKSEDDATESAAASEDEKAMFGKKRPHLNGIQNGESLKKMIKTTAGVDSSSGDSSNDGDHIEDNDKDTFPPWSDDLHRAFVEAVFKVGVRQASPSVILENMANEDNLPLTTERVKSRLQKYRNNARKSNGEFTQEFDAFLTKALTVGRSGVGFVDPGTVLDMMGVNKLLGADTAAILTYACMAEDSKRRPLSQAATQDNNQQQAAAQPQHDALPSARASQNNSLTPQELWKGSQEFNKYFAGSEIKLPALTEEERKSPLGASMSHVASLFYSMTHQIMNGRSRQDRRVVEKELKEQYDREQELKQQRRAGQAIAAATRTQSQQNPNSDQRKPAAFHTTTTTAAAPNQINRSALPGTEPLPANAAEAETIAMPPPRDQPKKAS